MKQIGSALERIADCLEFICSEQYGWNARPPKADRTGPEPEILYVDEELDVLREMRDEMERRKGKPVAVEDE